MLNLEGIQAEFPLLSRPIHGKRLAYLDSAATAQKPQSVIDALRLYYSEQNANIHRGVHHLSEVATLAFEGTREKVRRFINAKETAECIFVKGTTEGINLVASSFGEAFVQPGDEIIVSALEHHSNIVPWQLLCQKKSAHLKVIPMLQSGDLDLAWLDKGLTEKTKLVAVSHVSNALGTVVPIEQIIKKAHAHGVPVLIDGAQAVPHSAVDVQALDCDFYVFSSHKLYGPTGVGVLYGKRHWLERMPPYQSGGDMILSVSFEKTEFNALPFKFEAGTPAIGEVIGLGAAIDFLERFGMEKIEAHEQALLNEATERLSAVPGLRIVGEPRARKAVVSFVLKGVHPHDIGTILDQWGVAIRTGHHCAMPIMTFYKIPGTARASFGIYNTVQDIAQLIDGLGEVRKIFK